MALEDQLGATGGDDDNSTIPPQSILNDLITQRMPDVAQQGGNVDPQSVLNRLIRGARMRTPGSQQAQPAAPGADFSQFGKTQQELGPNAGVDGTDFSQFGEPESGTEANPATGDVPVPDTGNAVSVGAEAAARSAATQAGQTMKMAARGLPAMEQAEQGAFSPLNENLLTNPPKAEDSGAFQAGEAVTSFGKQIGPTPQEEAAHPIAAMVGGALGGVAAPLALGALNPVAGIAGGAALFGASSAEDTYEEAKKHGASDETASQAALLSGAVNAALGSLPIASVLQPVAKILPQASGYIMQILAQAAKDGIVFASVGEAQQYIGEQIAKMYDPNAGYSFSTERLISEFLAGGALGGLHAAFRRGEAQPDTRRDWNTPNVDDITPGARTGLPPPRPGEQDTGTKTDETTPPPPPPRPDTGGGETETPDAGGRRESWSDDKRSSMRSAATAYGEFTPSQIWKWSDDKLFQYVKDKNQADAEKQSPNTEKWKGQPRNDDAILRQYGLSDEEIKAMSPEEKKAKADEAIANGTFHYEPLGPGTASNPIDLKSGDDVQRAAAVASTDHTPAQGEAGNIQRGHATWNGMGITIEVPAGGTRRGTVPKTGEPWEAKHPNAYGAFKGLPKAADGQSPDVIIGPNPESPAVAVIDEFDPKTGKYRQSKALIGFNSAAEAMAAYRGILEQVS